MKNICSGEKRGMLKFAIACAMMVSSVAFAASPGYAVDINNGVDGADNSLRNSSYYTSGNVLDVITDTIEVTGDLPVNDYTISGVTNLIINGNGAIVNSSSTTGGYNHGYVLNDNTSLTINDLTFNGLGQQQQASGTSSVSLYGAGLYIQDNASSVTLNNVSYTNTATIGQTWWFLGISYPAHVCGGAIANNGNLSITDGVFSGNSLRSEQSPQVSAGGTGNAYGGAIYNNGRLTLTGVSIYNNSVLSENNQGAALGGGIYTTSDITLAGGNLFSTYRDADGNLQIAYNTDQNGNRNNDIYFAGGNLNVNGTGSDEYNIISGGIASASGDSTIVITDGGKLRLEGNNSDFSGGATVAGEGSVLTYAGSLNDSILKATTTVNGNGGAIELVVDSNYSLAENKFTTTDGVTGKFIKSGNAQLNLTGGDYSNFRGDVIVNAGILNVNTANGAYYIDATSNQIAQDATLNYTSRTNDTLQNISGAGNLVKSGTGNLTIAGDNSKFHGDANITAGNLIFDATAGQNYKFFAADSDVTLRSSLIYTAAQAEILNNENFANLVLSDNAAFEYHAASGEKVINSDFYTLSSGNTFTFNGDKASDVKFVLNNNLEADTTFANSELLLADGLTHLTNNLTFDNVTLNVLDRAVTDYTFDNLKAGTSYLKLDVDLGENIDGDLLTFTSGEGVLNVTELGIINDNGANYPKTIQVIKNNNGSSVSLFNPAGQAGTEIDPTIAGWSTNVYEYEIDASQTDNVDSNIYDSLTFNPIQAASPDSLKKMNNYKESDIRGFSLIKDSATYHIARDLETTEKGIFTVSGVSKDESVISGYRVSYTDNGDGTYTYGDVTGDKGSFFELTANEDTTLNIHDITIQDADRTNQSIKDGSIIYSNSANAVVNIEDAAFKSSHAAGNGGAFYLAAAEEVNITGSDFTDLTAGGYGGAIYSAVDLAITDSNFTNNTDKDGANDITLANGADVNFTVNEGVSSTLSGGLKTNGTGANGELSTFTKDGSGKLTIGGKNAGFTGNVDIKAGDVVFNAGTGDSFFGLSENSKITIADGTSLYINASKVDLEGGHFAGQGGLTIDTTGQNFYLYGNNADYTGNAVLNNTIVNYIAENNDDTIFGGTVEFLKGSQIVTSSQESKNYKGGNFKSDDNSAKFIKKDGAEFTLIGDNSDFTGNVDLNAGITSFEKTNDSAFFGGDVAIGSTLNYTTTVADTINGVISGGGTLNKSGAESLTVNNSKFTGVANINQGKLAVTSQNQNASNLDFTANIASNATLDYTAGKGSSIKLGGENSKLNFSTVQNGSTVVSTGATAVINAQNIVLDTIANAAGNNITLENANVTLNQQKYEGNYTLAGSVLDLVDKTANNYEFDSLSAQDGTISELKLDVSLLSGGKSTGDKITVHGGSGQLKITNIGIFEDDGSGKDKTVQVIKNQNGAQLSLAAGTTETGDAPKLAEWSTNVYEYDITAAQTDNQGSAIYDSLKFVAAAPATPDSLRTMNHEAQTEVRGFSVVTNTPYHIGRDLDTTLAGTFTVVGKDKTTSIISGQRADGWSGDDAGSNGSFFEVVNDTNLTIDTVTIQDANRVVETADDRESSVKDGSGSVVHLNNKDASVVITNAILKDSSAEGNGGAIAAHTGGLNITGSAFTGNSSGSLGGAIFAATEISIEGSNFSGNTMTTADGQVIANDIYVKDSTGVVNFTGENTISSGVAGAGVVNVSQNTDGNGKLYLSGNNDDFTGSLNVNSGSVEYTADSADDSYISGVTNIASGATVSINNAIEGENSNIDITGTFDGEGNLNIPSSNKGSVTINGDNSAFDGKANISGHLIVNMDSSDDKYFSDNAETDVDGTLTFNVAQDVEQTINNTGNNFSSFNGVFEKTGDGTLNITGDWYSGSFRNVDLNIEKGVLAFIADSADDMISAAINIAVSDNANFRVENTRTGAGNEFYLLNSLTGGEGSTFEIAGAEGSIVILKGNNSSFNGETLISSGDLEFTKEGNNAFVAGGVNINNAGSKLVYTTNDNGQEKISALKGTGTLNKQGTGDLTVNMDGFSGTADVDGGKLTVNADEQAEDANGEFAFDAAVAGGSTLDYIAGENDKYNIDENTSFSFDADKSDGIINFTNGEYNVSSDLKNAYGNATGFTDAVVNIITGENETGLALSGNYALNNSTLNLADDKITTTSIMKLTGNGTLNLDFDFTANNGQGAFDTLTANGGDASLTLNNIKTLNLTNDRGLIVEKVYDVLSDDVLSGATFAKDYSSELKSALYTYTVSASQGGTEISVVASGYVGNTLYKMNHEMSGDRTFHLAGASTDYYIGRALEQTLAGTLNIAGRKDKKDTIIATSSTDTDTDTDTDTTKGLSMFQVVYDDTKLNIKDITIEQAESDNGGSVIYQNNANSTVNVTNSTLTKNSTSADGGAVRVDAGSADFTNTKFSDNLAINDGGAMSIKGGEVTVNGGSFESNTANVNGGAIAVETGENGSAKLTIGNDDAGSAVTFSGNTAQNGGAVSLIGDNITAEITGAVFDSNKAAQNGGAIYNNSTGLTLTGVQIKNNTAANGSAIYNLGTATLTDVSFDANSGNYIYNGQNGNLTITSTGSYTLQNTNTADSTIENHGIINLNGAGYTFTLADSLSGGTVNTNGTVEFANIVSGATVNAKTGSLALNGNDASENALSNVTLNVKKDAAANLTTKNIDDGAVNVEEGGNFYITNGSDIEISADLKGSGTVTKKGTGTVALTGHNNSGFAGELNVNNGTVKFEKTNDNTFFGSDADINVDGANSKFDYVSSATGTDGAFSLDEGFANIKLNNGGTVSITGAGRDAAAYILNGGWLTSTGDAVNKLVFNNAAYTLNTLYNGHTNSSGDHVNDSISFNSSDITLGDDITGAEITDNRPYDTGALDYNLGGADYTLTDSVLDLSNRVAGDNYIFDALNFAGAEGNTTTNGLALDVNLVLDEAKGTSPYADIITANSGSGLVNITKLFITDDNGRFIENEDGSLSKGIIQVFKGNNNLQVADADGVQILSWATNVYRYGVESASSGLPDGHAQDSIEIIPTGNSSTDTLRDLNIYDPAGDNSGGNRGFSFIIMNNMPETNTYNIYRDLDTTSAGSFTVLGTHINGEDSPKSILSGKLEDLVLPVDDESIRYDQTVDKWYYQDVELSQKPEDTTITNYSDNTEEPAYKIPFSEFTPAGQTNGSMFELVNDTDFEMSHVSVEYAKRYESDAITDGSVIYADNNEVNVTLEDVDFKNNEVLAGNGGAVANISSNKFAINTSVITGNKASNNGGAIYNTSAGMTIAGATAYGNAATGGKGGAIYTSADMIITDSNFGVDKEGNASLNTHNGGQNDIYIDAAKVEFVVNEKKESTINSGIAGTEYAVFNKTGQGKLNLSGDNDEFLGKVEIAAGDVEYTADDSNDTFAGGSVYINSGSDLTMNIAQSTETTAIQDQILKNVSGDEDGNGTITKTGAGILLLEGNNSGFGGVTTINEGAVKYIANDENDRYFGGSTNLAGENTNLTFEISQSIENQNVSNIRGVESAVINKTDDGDLTLSGDNSAFYGIAYIKNGKLVYEADNTGDKYFGGSTEISDSAELVANVAKQDEEGNSIDKQTIGNLKGGADANFTKTGDGKIQLTGDNEFSGTTTIEQGILAYTAGEGNFVSGNTDIKENGTLEYTVLTGNDNLKSISGSGILSKLGSGNLNLAGDNSLFKGSVQIAEGRLSYETPSGNKFINANSYEIAENAELYINNTSSENVEVSNLAGYVDKNNQPKGSGKVIKEGNGTVLLGGDNSKFEGTLGINSGAVTFERNENTSYIAGITYIASDASLNYNTAIADSIENVTGSGTLNKVGTADLTFVVADNNVRPDFTANANEGTLKVFGDSKDVFDFNMNANNSATIEYTAAANSSIKIDENSKVKFGNGAQNAAVIFNGNAETASENNIIYDIAGDIANNAGNKIVFNDATLNLSGSEYNAAYKINNSVIDLRNDKTEDKIFNNLTTDNSELRIDVDLTMPDPEADKLIANGGSGGAIKVALDQIKLKDKTTDNGLGSKYELQVVGGNLTLAKDDTIKYWSTTAYKYKVSIAEGDQNIILEAIKAADANSLKEMNQQSGGRGFNFQEGDKPVYVIGSDLGETAEGSFVVTGIGTDGTTISGEGDKSFFEVVNDTDFSVEDLTMTGAHSENGGSVVYANNDSANINLDNVVISSSSSNKNGGAISNIASESFNINNSEIKNNEASGLGGAIYTETNITVTDTDFSGNKDKNGANDIYAGGSDAVVNLIAQNQEIKIESGLAGDGTINKAGTNDMTLSGNNAGFTGDLNVVQGNLTFIQNSEKDTYISGNTDIASDKTVTINNDKGNITTGTFSGEGTLNKDGSKDITLSGDNSKFKGTANINNGGVIFNADNTAYFSGKTNVNANGNLTVNTDKGTTLTGINGEGTINKNGSGALLFTGGNNFNGNLNINGGAFGMTSGATIGDIANATFAAGTGINLQNTNVVDAGNGQFTTNPSPASIEDLYFNSLTLLGDVDLDIDIDLKNEIADKVGAGTVYGNGSLLLDQDSLNVVSDTLLQNTSVQVAYGALADRVALDQGVTTVMGPIQKYDVTYNNGSLFFSGQGGSNPDIGSVNPAIMASSVATQVGGYLTQLQTLNAGFYHMNRYTKYPYQLRLTAESNNKYALTESPSYRRGYLPETSNAMWIQPYTTFEQVNLRGGIGVSNVAYGAMYGGDSDLVDLGHGYKGVLSAFVGYNGSHMSYNGVSMNMQGGALGLTGTVYKGNFFTGLTLSTGASAGDAFTSSGTDHFAMLTAGVASKTGYNLELKEGKLIVQPSLFLGYTFTNTFDYTNAAGVRVDSDPLHAITVAPGVKLIANLKNGWQPYAGVNMVWSIMDKTNVTAQDVRLPQLSTKPYVEYGVGVQKSWGQRFTAFFQTMIRNVGRTGIVLTAGFRWTLGKEPKYDNKSVNNKSQKKVIKSL